MAKLIFFYDLSSPWTYLAFNNVQAILEETSAQVIWRPFLVGGVFNAVNPSVYAARSNPSDPKVQHNFVSKLSGGEKRRLYLLWFRQFEYSRI